MASTKIRKRENGLVCRECSKNVLPDDYCHCSASKRAGIKDKQFDGKFYCGNCQKKLAWVPKQNLEVNEDDNDLILVTIDQIPGYEITEIVGLVSQLVGSSGLTAGVKGREAKSGALRALRESARKMDADAVIGINFSAFGAAGGLTNMFGGDAVGVLVSGTAVKITKTA